MSEFNQIYLIRLPLSTFTLSNNNKKQKAIDFELYCINRPYNTRMSKSLRFGQLSIASVTESA